MKIVFGTVKEKIKVNGKTEILVYKRGKTKEDDIIYQLYDFPNLKRFAPYDRVCLIINKNLDGVVFRNEIEYVFYTISSLVLLFMYLGIPYLVCILSSINLFYLIEYHESYSNLNKLLTRIIIKTSYVLILISIVQLLMRVFI